MAVCVLSKTGERLMPTRRYGRVRHLLESGRAVIVKYKPYFTIQLTYDTPGYVQPVEACMDTGYEHIGDSVKSEKFEYLNEQRDLLPDEKERHDDRREYRGSRRGRCRNRAPRFDNRCKTKGEKRKKRKGVCQQRQERKNAKRRKKDPTWYKVVDSSFAKSKAAKKPLTAKKRKQAKEALTGTCEILSQNLNGSVAVGTDITQTASAQIENPLNSPQSEIPAIVPQTEESAYASQVDHPTTDLQHDTQTDTPDANAESRWKPVEAPDWLPPSIRNKADRHVDLLVEQTLCFPVQHIYVEMGEFDTMVMKAIDQGKPIPEGTGYQRGDRYGIESLRAAVFTRDGHKCLFCGRGIKDGAVLHVHHAYYWRGQHGNSLDELATCCEQCHTQANHQKGGLLWGYDKGLKSYAAPTFMNQVRYYIVDTYRARIATINNERQKVLEQIASGERQPVSNEVAPLQPVQMPEVHFTYGAATKIARKELGLEKSHANDAYAMGEFHPSVRAEIQHYKKRRRNNRILSKFYDARYVDIRDGKIKTGAELSCGRTNRKYPRNSERNQRIYRGEKVRKGHTAVRRHRYAIQPGTIVLWKGEKRVTTGSKNLGKQIAFKGDYDPVKKKCKQLVATNSKVKVILYPSGWTKV